MTNLIKNGHVLEPGTGLDDICDVLIDGDRITEVEKNIETESDRVIDADGCWVMPGFIDLHVHFRDPGLEYQETLATGGRAASICSIGARAAGRGSGRIRDKVGRKRLLVMGASGEVVFSVLYLAGLGFAPLFAIRLLHGFVYGVCSTTTGTTVTAPLPDSRQGEGVGYYMLSLTLRAATGPLPGLFRSHTPVSFSMRGTTAA